MAKHEKNIAIANKKGRRRAKIKEQYGVVIERLLKTGFHYGGTEDSVDKDMNGYVIGKYKTTTLYEPRKGYTWEGKDDHLTDTGAGRKFANPKIKPYTTNIHDLDATDTLLQERKFSSLMDEKNKR